MAIWLKGGGMVWWECGRAEGYDVSCINYLFTYSDLPY